LDNIITIEKNCSIWISFEFWNVIYSCEAEFKAISLSMARDPSEIILICWFAAQETFLVIINVENGCAISKKKKIFGGL